MKLMLMVLEQVEHKIPTRINQLAINTNKTSFKSEQFFVRVWRYRYGLYRTNQHHRTGTEYYRTVTDSVSVFTGFIRVISGYIYRTGKL